MTERNKKISTAKSLSLAYGTPITTCIVDDEYSREFFRFHKGVIVEYDLTRYSVPDPGKSNGRQQKIVVLPQEERDAVNEFSCEVLSDLPVR